MTVESGQSAEVTVVIPAYNRRDTILACLDSVLNQTVKNIEVIVVDDCSADDTVEVVNSVTDPRVRCVKLAKNSGACCARNTGADLAKGRYIAFQDSDDLWHPEKLEKQLKYLKEKKLDFVFCAMERENYAGETWIFPKYAFDENGDIRRQILWENPAGTQTMLMTREAFQQVRFDESIRKFQDWDFAIRAAGILRIGYVAEPLVTAKVQENSISRNVPRYRSLAVLYHKYEDLIVADSALNAHFLARMGNACHKEMPHEAHILYGKSLKAKFDVKVFARYCYTLLAGKDKASS